MELNNIICTKYGYGYVKGIHCRMTAIIKYEFSAIFMALLCFFSIWIYDIENIVFPAYSLCFFSSYANGNRMPKQ